MHELYVEQVRLLVGVLPDIATEDVFALKGGTAINLFCRDMPRLSVDIDLTYLPDNDRDASLKDIDQTLDRIMKRITRDGHRRAQRIAGGGGGDTRIEVSEGFARIKIETSPVTRGTVRPVATKRIADAVESQFGFAEMQVVAFEDLFGGKLHAALDRQHPRDLFDVKLLYENEGLTDELFRVFLVYVASSSRPIHELLSPRAPLRKDDYENHFVGMTRDDVSWEVLCQTRTCLHEDVKKRLTGDSARFLLALHDVKPDFGLIELPEAAELPAVRWKLQNLERLRRENGEKHRAQRDAIEALLS